MMSPINLILMLPCLVEYTRRYTAAFTNVLLTPFSAQMDHQDGSLSTVNNKRVVPISSNLPSHMGSWQDRKKGKSQIFLYSSVNLCISFLENFTEHLYT